MCCILVEVVLVMFADFEHFMQKFAYVFQKRRCFNKVLKEYRESRGNREGDGIWAAGAGSGRDRAWTLPAED